MATLFHLRQELQRTETLSTIADIMKATSKQHFALLHPAVLSLEHVLQGLDFHYRSFFAAVPDIGPVETPDAISRAANTVAALLPVGLVTPSASKDMPDGATATAAIERVCRVVNDQLRTLASSNEDVASPVRRLIITAQTGFCGEFDRRVTAAVAKTGSPVSGTDIVVGRKGAQMLRQKGCFEYPRIQGSLGVDAEGKAKAWAAPLGQFTDMLIGAADKDVRDSLLGRICSDLTRLDVVCIRLQPAGLPGKPGNVYDQRPQGSLAGSMSPLLPRVKGRTRTRLDGPHLAYALHDPFVINDASTEPYRISDDANIHALILATAVIIMRTYALVAGSAVEEARARFIAMNQAADNIREHITATKLTIARTRQAMITRELVEIISGAKAYEEAMK